MPTLHGGVFYKLNKQCICRCQSQIHSIIASPHWKCSTSATNQVHPRHAPLPIPDKKRVNNHSVHRIDRNDRNDRGTFAPWQHRSVTLHDQCYTLPEMIVARIESATNAKIESLSTALPQTAPFRHHDDSDSAAFPEIHGADTAALSALAPSAYHQVTISGDGHAVDHAMAIYMHYFQVHRLSAATLSVSTLCDAAQ